MGRLTGRVPTSGSGICSMPARSGLAVLSFTMLIEFLRFSRPKPWISLGAWPTTRVPYILPLQSTALWINNASRVAALGLMVGRSAARSAAALPATHGAAMLVPVSQNQNALSGDIPYLVDFGQAGPCNWAERMVVSGAMISGFIRPPTTGPRLLVFRIVFVRFGVVFVKEYTVLMFGRVVSELPIVMQFLTAT